MLDSERERGDFAGAMPRLGPLKIKAQLLCGEEFAVGPGKADLMEAIEREGSISAAGRAMGMSYRRAWVLVDTMNRCWREPLVDTVPGGGQMSGARLTPAGRKVLAAYRELEADLARSADGGAMRALEELLLPVPRT
jgi:molybdate transport system regulatory protein